MNRILSGTYQCSRCRAALYRVVEHGFWLLSDGAQRAERHVSDVLRFAEFDGALGVHGLASRRINGVAADVVLALVDCRHHLRSPQQAMQVVVQEAVAVAARGVSQR